MNASTQQNPYAPPRAQVSDITDADAPVEPAGRGIRFGAAMIDGLLFTAAYVPLIIAMFGQQMTTFDPQLFVSIWGMLSAAIIIALLAVTFVLVRRNGQTIGKKLVGIKVVRSDGTRATLGRIFWLRNVVNGIPSAIPLLGYVYVLIDHLLIFGDKRQCLHDRIADTIVVNA
jgi:uncharacterized RDD family membrane protein YckC